MYDDIFALRGWKHEEINGSDFELNSIMAAKWEGMPCRVIIQRQRRDNGDADLWEGEYTYRCILTNDYDSTDREIVVRADKSGWGRYSNANKTGRVGH